MTLQSNEGERDVESIAEARDIARSYALQTRRRILYVLLSSLALSLGAAVLGCSGCGLSRLGKRV